MGPEWIGLITAIIAALIAASSQIRLTRYRIRTEKEIQKLEKVERYSTPFLNASCELYNKLNDVVSRSADVLQRFELLPDRVIVDIRSIGDALSKPYAVFLAHLLYLFARFFASIEAIKKDIGLLHFSSEEEAKAFQLRRRQTEAVFFSNRLFENFQIRKDDLLKYRGVILEPEQILIADSMLIEKDGKHECLSFYEFCLKIANDNDFRQCLSPLLRFTSNLQEISEKYSTASDIDFRWSRLITFASFLRKLIKQIDKSDTVILLPELEEYELNYFQEHKELQVNIKNFKKGYPDP